MNKISIVVATMWRFQPFIDFLKDIVEHPAVGEVIIINNAWKDTPTDSVLQHQKVRLYNFPENIYVNPAWNVGVAISAFDNLCILSDDVIFDLKLLTRIQAQLTQGKIFAVNVPFDTTVQIKGLIEFKKFHEGMQLYHYGCLIFMHKDDWVPIPSGLNISYGDCWMWDSMKAKYNENYVIEDLFFYTPSGATLAVIPDRDHIYGRETELVKSYWPFLMRQLEKEKDNKQEK
jgi:hypothetical protein